MTNLNIIDRKVAKDLRDSGCPRCSEVYGHRRVMEASDEAIVHSKCLDAYESEIRETKRQAQRDADEQEKAERKQRCEETAARRGTLSEFHAKCWSKGDEVAEQDKNIRNLAWKIHSALDRVTVIEKWVDGLKSDAVHALRWSSTVFAAAADVAVAKELKRAFDHGCSLEEIKETLTTDVIREARATAKSTSPASNML